MTNNLFDSQTIGSDPRWWTGIIVDDVSWKGNQLAEKWSSIDQLPGWGARYKVRIVGKHTENRNKLTDDKLELCEVMYPVTAGTGHGASYQTSNLRKGSVVFGIYKDSEGNEPLIIGCIGNNEQTSLNNLQQRGFDPLSGFTLDTLIPYYSIAPGGSPQAEGSGQGGNSSHYQANTPNSPLADNVADQDAAKEENSSLAVPSQCDRVPLSDIQIRIRNLIQSIEKVRNQINSWRQTVTEGIKDVEQFIRNQVENASKFIAGGVKWVIVEIQKYVTNKINNTMKDAYYAAFPNQRPALKEAAETANNLIACLFRKIISNLLKMIGKFLLAAVDRFINVPLCAVENMLGGLLGKLVGLISSALNAILAPIKAILGAFDIVGDVINFVVDLLSLLSCDENPDCPEVKEWNIWDGPGSTGSFSFDLNGLVNKVKTYASNVTDSINPDNFNFDLNFDDVFANNCNVDAILCGPPTVEFFGGGGFGASGNAIISATGQILGVDITSPGSGYINPPFVRFYDACGKGRGAVGTAVLDQVSADDGQTTIGTGGQTTTGTGGQTTIGVVSVIINDPGINYISVPDGDRGGDGRVWAPADNTTVKHPDGTYDIPYIPGSDIEVLPGDTIRLPNDTTVEIGNETIVGGTDYTVNTAGTITAPVQQPSTFIRGDYPGLDSGQYPVILYLCGLEIENAGFNYSDGDKIVISPDNGAVAVPKFGPFGALESIKITSFGEGFKEIPNIYIESESGNNARLIPRFCIDRVSEDQFGDPGVQDQIVSVVDCVGKAPQVDFFRVPQ
jgi:hypothetical protein